MEWKGAPYFLTKPDGYNTSNSDKHVWNLDSYFVSGLIWAYPAVLISGEKLGFSPGFMTEAPAGSDLQTQTSLVEGAGTRLCW